MPYPLRVDTINQIYAAALAMHLSRLHEKPICTATKKVPLIQSLLPSSHSLMSSYVQVSGALSTQKPNLPEPDLLRLLRMLCYNDRH